MKLSKDKEAKLIQVLNAQSGVARMENAEAYKSALAEVADCLNTKDGRAVGGVTKEIYEAYGKDSELGKAAAAHLAKAKEKAAAAKEKAKAPKAPKAKKEKTTKLATPEEEKARAVAIVDFFNAVTGKRKLEPKAYNHAYNVAKKYVDFEKGGLKNEAAAGKKTPWERFGSFPGVKEAAKAHRTHVAEKAKNSPAGPA